ncbi:MAG: ribose 5-phosphate isomerase B [Anaerolineae bacterium]|jgi:ribose 5-phosphate isomerase B
MTYSEDQVKAIVRKVLLRTLGPDGVDDSAAKARPNPEARRARPAITEADVLAVPSGGRLSVPADAMITPLARDTAIERRVELAREADAVLEAERTASSSTARTVALGADHGGYAMKEDLKGYLAGLGYEVVDCGTGSTASVDYPDFAYAVAKLVSDGRAWRGIMVDGAGIGSCMAANKVPGVRAAMCYDHATAVNSREHNDANVLTLGGVLLGPNLARQIAKTWLETDFGGDRHARRVNKIMAIEKRFLRK